LLEKLNFAPRGRVIDDAPTSDSTQPVSGETSTGGREGVADLGILLVHGIGEQLQGETLTKFAEPVIDWMRDWLHRESESGSLVASSPVEAALRPPLLQPGTPAHARVVIGARRDDPQAEGFGQEWLFAEAWWGAQALTPPISSFTSWLVTRGPWLMLFHFNQRLLASPKLHNGWKWLIGVPLTLVWAVLSLFLSIVLIAASLLAIIPIGRVRRAVFAALRRIAGVVGDSYGQLRSPIQRAAFESATLDALQWLRPRCRRLAVIAHSQGAAIAHEVLRGGEPRADLLVTVGAGITKLEALRYAEGRGSSDAAFLAPLLLVATAIVTLRTRALGLDGVESNFVLPFTLGVVAFALVAEVWASVRGALKYLRQRSPRISLDQAQPDLHWTDIVGTHDPVPGGQLVRFFDLPNVDSKPIPVLRSWLADHTSYWTARLSFMQVLVPQLAECAELPAFVKRDAGMDARFAEAQRRLNIDLRALSAARFLDLLALVVPFFVAPGRLIAAVERLRTVIAGRAPGTPGGQTAPLRFIDDTIVNVEQGVSWTTGVLTGDPGTWARSAVDLGVALLLLSLALLAWRRLESAVWRGWSASRNEKALRGPLKLDGLPKPMQVETSLYNVLSTALYSSAMGAMLLMAIGVSAVWSFAPEWVNEAGIYRLLGETAAALFVVLLIVGQVAERMKEFISLRERWRRWRSTHETLTWPKVQVVLSRLVEAALGLTIVWAIVDEVVTLPVFLKPDLIFIGVFVLLRGFLTLLDSIWQELDRAKAGTRTRLTLLMLPIVIGATAVTLFAFTPRVEPLTVSMIGSGLAVVGCVTAGIILLAVRRTQPAR